MTRATGLKLITTGTGKRVMNPSCTIKMDDTANTFRDFVAVGFDNTTGITSLLHNTDAVTLGMAMMMINNAFESAMESLSVEQQADVYSVLKA